MASRKEELLSRLRSTLAIVQSTRYDNSLPVDGSGFQGIGNQASSGQSRNLPETSLYSHVANRDAPASGVKLSQSSVASVDNRWSDQNSVGSPWNTKTEQRNRPVATTGIPSFGNINDVDDEDEFLYGSSSSSKEPTNPEADVLLSYIPERNPDHDFNSYSSTYAPSSGYQQQTAGFGDQGTRVSDMTSDMLKNVLRLVSKQSPDTDRHSESQRDGTFYADSTLDHRSQGGRTVTGQLRHPQHDDLVRSVASEAQNVYISQTLASQSFGRYSDLKLASAYQGQSSHEISPVQLPVKMMQSHGSSFQNESSMQMTRENSDLNSTVDKILQTINLDGDLRKLMQEKLKKEDDGKLVKEELERKKQLSLERMKLEEEKARREAEEQEKAKLGEQNKLLAEKLIKGLLKVKEGTETASQQNPLMDLLSKTAGIDLDIKPIPSIGNLQSAEVADKGKTDLTAMHLKNYPAQFIPRSAQLGKQKDADASRLIVTSGSLFKPEIEAAKLVKPEFESTKHRSGMDASWEQSTEEFLRKLNSRDESKADGKRARNSQEEQSSSRMSRERGNDRQSVRSSERKSRCSRESISSESESDNCKDEKAEEKSRRNFEKTVGQLSKYSKSPLTMSERVSLPESFDAQSSSRPDATIRRSLTPAGKLGTAGDDLTALTAVHKNKSERSKDQMKADIEALQAELANLQKINSGLLKNDPSESSDAAKVKSESVVQNVALGFPAPTVDDRKVIGSDRNSQPNEVPAMPVNRSVDATKDKLADGAVSKPKEPSDDQKISCGIVAKPTLTRAQIRKLESSKAEMLVNISLLQHELEKLEQLNSDLLQGPASEERDMKLKQNKRTQLEIEDHLWALRKATKELTEQYLQGDLSEESKASVSTAETASLIVPESKMLPTSRETVTVSTASLVTSSTASVSSTQPQAAAPTLTDALASTSDSLKVINTTSKTEWERSRIISQTGRNRQERRRQ